LNPVGRRSPYSVHYEQEFSFSLSPEELWESIAHTERFEGWWAWLRELRLDGDGLVEGAQLHGVVTPPLPYRMRLHIGIERCVKPERIEASVAGDLRGRAHLALEPDRSGTLATVAWDIEMRQRPMRVAALFGRPLLRWGHDRVVEATVESFRRNVETPGPPTPGPPTPGGRRGG